jgi:hypothetical protein
MMAIEQGSEDGGQDLRAVERTSNDNANYVILC